MIDLSGLRRIITHINCGDAILATAIACDASRRVPVVPVQYDSPEHVELVPEPGDLFLDMTPWHEKVKGVPTEAGRAQIRRWVDAGAWVIDHHLGAEHVVAMFGERGIYSAEPGVSAATLAYRHLMYAPEHGELAHEEIPKRLSEIVGRRDTWDRDHPDFEAGSAAVAALHLYGFQVIGETVWSRGWKAVEDMLTIGPFLLAADRARARALLSTACRSSFDDLWVVVVNTANEADASNIADLTATCSMCDGERAACPACDGSGHVADLVIAYHVHADPNGGERMLCRLRTRGDRITALGFAEHHRGGGHRHAAGFTVPITDRSALGEVHLRLASYLYARAAKGGA